MVLRRLLTLFFVILVATAVSDVTAAEVEDVLWLLPPNTLPDVRPTSTILFPVDRLSGLATDRGLRLKFASVRIIVLDIAAVINLGKIHQPALKSFLRMAVADGRQIWVIGIDIPDNFIQDYLDLPGNIRTYRSRDAHHLASGVVKEGDRYVTKGLTTSLPISRQEIIQFIRQ
ncbi:MAG: hypothetical protein ACE5JQ_00855 [Candidatus Methylomirabilales bacterium]